MGPGLHTLLAEYFKDDPVDERDPTEAMWMEGDSLAPFIVTPLRNCVRALECAAPWGALVIYGCLRDAMHRSKAPALRMSPLAVVKSFQRDKPVLLSAGWWASTRWTA